MTSRSASCRRRSLQIGGNGGFFAAPDEEEEDDIDPLLPQEIRNQELGFRSSGSFFAGENVSFLRHRLAGATHPPFFAGENASSAAAGDFVADPFGKFSSYQPFDHLQELKKFSQYSESAVTKKPKLIADEGSRSSDLNPFKAKKEKLRDRVAALQQLVAPFGKTDTASVLTEAVGYITFLHNQIETLSTPSMRDSTSKNANSTARRMEETGEELYEPNLRSRGLCLVPLSFIYFIINH